jgi:hypothetical protein
MLVKSAPDQIDLCRAELDALLEQQLIALEELTSGLRRPLVTLDGDLLLQAIARKN